MGCLDAIRILLLVFVVIPFFLAMFAVLGALGLFVVIALLGLPLAFLLAA
jgi:hypothetical protein